MTIIFTVLCVILIIVVLLRQIDLLSIAAVCLIVYNYYCFVGNVWIASHEKAGVNYYESIIDDRVYLIVVAQVLVMIVVILLYDMNNKDRVIRLSASKFSEGKYSTGQMRRIFKYAGIVSLLIMLTNIGTIGISGLSADKSEVWQQTNVLYVTGLWLAMAVFTYAIKTKQYTFLFLSLPQILVHLFIGSRAYFAVICIVALVCISVSKSYSIKRNIALLLLGFILMMGIMLYKQIFEEVKAGDIDAIVSILQNPDTYNWIFRWGEPRIVLANFNYVVETGLTLDSEQIVGRIISAIPFLNNFISIDERDLLLSTIVGGDLNSSYGLASNIWGEFYAIGSFPLVAIMYALWLSFICWGNRLIASSKWSASFWLPLIAYFAFYIHRMDLVKVLGNAKMLIFAMIIWWIISCIVIRKISFGKSRNDNSSLRND